MSTVIIKPVILALLFSSFSLAAFAGLEVREFSSPEQEQRYKKLIDELRCLVCQNQNLADSNSQLAQDLRNKVYEMVTTNQTDEQVAEYMVSRYGEYVLYNPPLNPVTSILWIGPFVVLIIAVLLLLLYIQKRNKTRPVNLTDEDHKRSRQLLDEDDEDNNR